MSFEGMGDLLSYMHFSDRRVMISAAGVFTKEAGSIDPALLHCIVIDKKGGRRCGTGEGEQTGAAIFSRPGRWGPWTGQHAPQSTRSGGQQG